MSQNEHGQKLPQARGHGEFEGLADFRQSFIEMAPFVFSPLLIFDISSHDNSGRPVGMHGIAGLGVGYLELAAQTESAQGELLDVDVNSLSHMRLYGDEPF